MSDEEYIGAMTGDFNEISSLRAENEKLREENDAWRMDGASCSEEVTRLRAENEKLNGQAAMNGRLLTENAELREENRLVGLQMDRMADEIEKLRAALKPFADLLATAEKIRPSHDRHLLWVETIDLRAAAAALKETGDE